MKHDSTLSHLLDEVIKRSAKQGLVLLREQVTLHLGKEDGPILDLDDILAHTIISPSDEVIFAATLDSAKGNKSREVKLLPICI
jgi:hypothetical protein